MSKTRCPAFTLAELLIALAILAEIATFTIPKIISAQQNGQNKAIGKETMGMLSEAVQKAKLATDASTAIPVSSLTQYMNYVKVDTTSLVDSTPNDGTASYSCASYTCIKLHNGSILIMSGSITGSTGLYSCILDTNGYKGQLESLGIVILGTGRLMTYDDYLGSTNRNPSWFSW